LKILPESIGNVKSLETLNISGCSQLEKLSEGMGDMESLTMLLADGIENEQFFSSIGQLKHVRLLSLRGYNSTPPSSLISECVLNWKRWLPISFIVKHLNLSNCGLSDRATNCVDFSGLSALEFLNLAGNKFSSLPCGIGFLSKLGFMSVEACKYLVSIPDLPSSLHSLIATDCKSLKRVRLPTKSKKELCIGLEESHLLEEIQGIEGLSNSFWYIRVDDCNHLPNILPRSFVKVLFLSVSLAYILINV
jgi:Leucine-rich repeat (LRR) protein